MLRFVADENFNNRILRALRRDTPELDIIRVQDTEIYQADDPTVLEWAAQTAVFADTRRQYDDEIRE